ncbi:hypothetical protein MTR67_006903 [Solanum verrucosum]|uniref:Gag-pol polyprotein n=1 Tax=Solanum verrucosum TaxID=315347 RepID=A0AAF0PZ72_SOLVR|nr:hypothetical protein MTR67_006903 [Solanum verrucosum]
MKPLEVFTPIGESIIARRIYRNCIVTVCGRDTLIGLVELQMVDCDVIMGMDWLASCYATIDCRTKMVHFHIPKEAVLEWKGYIGAPRGVTNERGNEVTRDLTYEEVPIAILDRQIRKSRNKEVASVKVLWRNQEVEEVTWEAEEAKKLKYPHLFQTDEKDENVELRH